MKRKKIKILNLIVVVLVVLLIASVLFAVISVCRHFIKKEQYIRKLEKQASENAVNYINNKYGFSASVVSTKIQKEELGLILRPLEPTGKVFVNLNYKGKTFEVYISGEENTIEGVDNYQYDEIVTDVLNLIETKIDIKPYSNLIYFGRIVKDNHNGLIKELYIKDNLQELIDNNNFRILLSYIDETNLEYIKQQNLLKDFINSKIILVNYYSVDAYNNSSALEYYIRDTGEVQHEFTDNAINIESVYELDNLDNEEVNYYDFEIKEFKEIYYYIREEAYKNVYLSSTTISDASNWIGYGAFKNVKQIYNAYLVNEYCSYLYIYIPLDKISDYDVNNIKVGIECGDTFRTSSGKVVGNYFVSGLYLGSCDENKDIKFTLLYSTYEK